MADIQTNSHYFRYWRGNAVSRRYFNDFFVGMAARVHQTHLWISVHYTGDSMFFHAVMVIAGDNQAAAALLSGGGEDVERANQVLDRYYEVLEDTVCYLIDIKGNVVASSNRNDPDSYVGHNYSFRPYFKQALTGEAGCYFALGVTSGERGYYTSYPLRDGSITLTGLLSLREGLRVWNPRFSSTPYVF
jgi:hypothetical protein